MAIVHFRNYLTFHLCKKCWQNILFVFRGLKNSKWTSGFVTCNKLSFNVFVFSIPSPPFDTLLVLSIHSISPSILYFIYYSLYYTVIFFILTLYSLPLFLLSLFIISFFSVFLHFFSISLSILFSLFLLLTQSLYFLLILLFYCLPISCSILSLSRPLFNLCQYYFWCFQATWHDHFSTIKIPLWYSVRLPTVHIFNR